MKLTHEIAVSLQREYDLCSGAASHYRKTLRDLEKKHRLTTRSFLKKFEAGQLGDDAEFFEWHACATLLAEWQKVCDSLRSAIR